MIDKILGIGLYNRQKFHHVLSVNAFLYRETNLCIDRYKANKALTHFLPRI
jgi:hypothetical protein